MKSEIKRLILITIILIVILALSVFVKKVLTSRIVESQIPDTDWLNDNCDCIERERFKCPEGFEVDVEKRLCKGQGEWTNVLLGCSKYNCTGEIYEIK